MTTLDSIIDLIRLERTRQDEKHGQRLDKHDIPRVLGEEFGEVCAAINDGEDDWRLVQELVQVAAVAVKAIETLQAVWEESRKLEGISSEDC